MIGGTLSLPPRGNHPCSCGFSTGGQTRRSVAHTHTSLISCFVSGHHYNAILDCLSVRAKVNTRLERMIMRTLVTATLILSVLYLAWPTELRHKTLTNRPVAPLSQTRPLANFLRQHRRRLKIKLNNVYGELLELLKSNKVTHAADALQNSEQQWIAFRDAGCTASGLMYEGGSFQGVTIAACFRRLTEQRSPARASRISLTSASVASAARRCSGRRKTDSYSTSNGVESKSPKRPLSTSRSS